MAKAQCESNSGRAVPAKPRAILSRLKGKTGRLVNRLNAKLTKWWNTTYAKPGHALRLKALFDQEPPDILSTISPNDDMYIKKLPEHYFRVGISALRCIQLAMLTTDRTGFQHILDFPSGHGRVLRVLKAAFPKATITACDLDRDAVDFCAKTFGAIPIYSTEQPEQISIQGSFDLVWCGSLLTHLDQDRWPGFLNFFRSVLSPGGLLLFSVQGREGVRRIRTGEYDYHLADTASILATYDRNGFAYQNYPPPNRLPHYGISLASPPWILERILQQPGFRLINYIEKGWDNHQDVIACVRE